MAGIYIHIPFCRSKCRYCAFASVAHSRQAEEQFVDGLLKEIELASKGLHALDPGAGPIHFETLYIGGGTPSVLAPASLKRIIDAARAFSASFASPPFREVTVEANPESVTADFLQAFIWAGGTRLSLGVQDMTERGLEILGRAHGVHQAERAVELARRAGVENLGIDLIYAICAPEGCQDVSWLGKTLERAAALEPDHVSCYELTLEPGTRMEALAACGELKAPDQEQSAELMEMVETFWHDRGLEQYEISNYSVPGRRCLHNMNYWLCGDYIGFGPSAHSHFAGVRSANAPELDIYLASLTREERPLDFQERLKGRARFREAFVMAMRLVQGADASWFRALFGTDPVEYYGDELTGLVELGLFHISSEGRIRLTVRGRRLFNWVMCRFV